MSKKKKNPLEDIDPILKDSFSSKKDTPEDQSFNLNEVEEDVEVEKKGKNAPSVKKIQFPNEEDAKTTSSNIAGHVFNNIPIQVSAELGRCVITLQDLKNLSEGSMIELDRFVGEPLDLVVNGEVIAQGEVVSVDNKFGLKIKTISDHFQV